MNQIEFDCKVYEVVGCIPYGKVTTYGRIAVLIGCPNNARRVGRALSYAPNNIPCHRVVNSQGKTVTGWNEQVVLLKQEGVLFKSNGCVNFEKALWRLEE